MNLLLKGHMDTMFAVQIVKKEATFCRKLIRFLEIALIFVNFLINAILKTERMEALFGKHFLNFKSMLSMTVQNSVAIYAIRNSSSI